MSDYRAKLSSQPYLRWFGLLLFALTLPWTILIVPFYGPNDFTYSQLNTWLILSVVTIGLNLLTGLAGMISLGHSALFALGAFGAGYCLDKLHWPFVLALLGSVGLVGLAGLGLGLPALRLSGPYLAVATFAFAIAMPQFLFTNQVNTLFANPADLTSSPGVFQVPKQTLPGFDVHSDLSRYYLFVLITTLMLGLARALWRSHIGRVWRAIRENELAAQAVGINTARYKLLAFGLSAVFAGVGGAMYTAQVGQLDAHNQEFSVLESVLFLTAIVLGGIGSIGGSFVGVAILTILPNLTSALNQLFNDVFGYKIENFESIFYGLIIILSVFFMPNGVVSTTQKLYQKRKP